MSIEELVRKYQKERSFYLSENYNEAQLRNDFINPFFDLLGWDVENKEGKAIYEREVILEEPLKNESKESAKKPDYTFRLFSERKFFVETKKPSVAIEKSSESALQVRRYGWTAKLKVSILTNFEHLIIYDCTVKPDYSDNFNKCRIRVYHYTEYETVLKDLKTKFSKDSVYSGNFEDIWKEVEVQVNQISVNELFLEQINKWRVSLGERLIEINRKTDEKILNDTIQAYLNCFIFLRVCEDRDLESYKDLLKYAEDGNPSKLIEKIKSSDLKYNSGLFKLPMFDEVLLDLHPTILAILNELYYPYSPYSFSVLSSSILGDIYEVFLSHKLEIDGSKVRVVKKPENIERDIITTPTYIINEILRETLLEYCRDKTAKEIENVKIADIACGSGAFLLEAFELLNSILIDKYQKENLEGLIQTSINTYRLNFNKKKKLLVNCIYGVDKDYNAVQAAKFGLLLKLLEGESNSSTLDAKPILPDLKESVRWGNSLIGLENVDLLPIEDKKYINPFNFNFDGFDIIVGNPPYMKTEDINKYTPLELPIYKKEFKVAYKQFDKYYLFIEKSINLLKPNGYFGVIIPSKFTKIGSGLKLRELLSSNKNVRKVISFGRNQVFKNRTTYTCLLILTKSENTQCLFQEVRNLQNWRIRTRIRDEYDIIHTNELSERNWILLSESLQKVYTKLLHQSITLEELIGSKNIFNGIQTSANEVYVITNYTVQDELISFTHNGREWSIEPDLMKPYFKTSKGIDNLNTYREFKPNSLLLFPYKIMNDNVKLIEINELKLRYPLTYNYLLSNIERLNNRDLQEITSKETEWYSYGRVQGLNSFINDEKIIVGVLSIGDKYAVDRYKTFVTSGGTAGYCAITLPLNFKYSIYYVQAILNSKYVEWVSTLIGDIFRGGYFAHGTSVLKKLPIRVIDFNNEEEKNLHDKIVNQQKSLIDLKSKSDKTINNNRENSFFSDEFSRTKSKLADTIRSLYNFSTADDELVPLIQDLYESD